MGTNNPTDACSGPSRQSRTERFRDPEKHSNYKQQDLSAIGRSPAGEGASVWEMGKLTAFLCLLVGPLKGLPGGTGETAEEVLLQRPATGVSDPHVLGDSAQCSQLGGPGSQDPAQLGPGDR